MEIPHDSRQEISSRAASASAKKELPHLGRGRSQCRPGHGRLLGPGPRGEVQRGKVTFGWWKKPMVLEKKDPKIWKRSEIPIQLKQNMEILLKRSEIPIELPMDSCPITH